MRHYLLSRKATRAMSCSDLFRTENECENDDSIVCAAKCLFSDVDSQIVGLAEAHILSQLHASTTPHPGRQYIVDLFGMYCQTTKQGYFKDDAMIPLEMGVGDKMEDDWILLLEFCQHGSIWDWIRQHPDKVGYHQWLSWALQLMEAVAYIHEAGLVHHDIKPHNILLDSAFNAKLSDFGASRFLPTDTSNMDEASGSSVALRASLQFGLEEGRGRGTLPYSAPEMFASASRGAHYGQAIDIYSLGISLYVIGLTAQEPFHKLKSVMEMIVWIKKGGFWLWEDQGWVHDRGSIPKARPSSRLSTSSAIQSYSQVQGRACKNESQFRSAISGSSPMSSQVATPPLAPINTQLYRETALSGPSSASSINSPGGVDSYYNYPRTSPLMQPGGAGNAFSTGYSPEGSYRGPQPTTPVSPLPLPSPIIKTQTPRSSSRRDENRKSGEMVMRFLNGEVVRPEVVQLLKDMCQLDPELRPDATSILQRLREMKALLDLEHEAEADMDVNMSM
ncbi:hypothetical protein BGZ50_001499 [Haplosporangium sp. Z 11]|nr:hypothetical protein BGZ50_001499 [Haplosporangium sp. Z 11]